MKRKEPVMSMYNPVLVGTLQAEIDRVTRALYERFGAIQGVTSEGTLFFGTVSKMYLDPNSRAVSEESGAQPQLFGRSRGDERWKLLSECDIPLTLKLLKLLPELRTALENHHFRSDGELNAAVEALQQFRMETTGGKPKTRFDALTARAIWMKLGDMHAAAQQRCVDTLGSPERAAQETEVEVLEAVMNIVKGMEEDRS